MNCPDCKSVVLFGEHYHRPGCNFGRELRATEFDTPTKSPSFNGVGTDELADEFDAWELADRERDER